MDVRRGTCAPLEWFSAMKEPGNDVLETCDLLKGVLCTCFLCWCCFLFLEQPEKYPSLDR